MSSTPVALEHTAHSKGRHSWEATRQFLMALTGKIGQDDCAGLAAEMAYHLILSLTPLVLFITALSGLFGGQQDIYETARNFISRFAPVPAIELLNETLKAIIHGSSTGLTAIGLLGTLWSASGAAGIVVKGLHRAYALSNRSFPFWYCPLMSICIVLSLGMVSVVATYLLMFGNFISSLVGIYLQVPPQLEGWIDVVRWIIILIGIRWGATFAYTVSLHPRTHKMAWSNASAGSWFFVFTWLVGSWLFSLYLNNMNQLNPVYGSLGVLIILVTWFYYSAFIFFIGGEITALCVCRSEGKPFCSLGKDKNVEEKIAHHHHEAVEVNSPHTGQALPS